MLKTKGHRKKLFFINAWRIWGGLRASIYSIKIFRSALNFSSFSTSGSLLYITTNIHIHCKELVTIKLQQQYGTQIEVIAKWFSCNGELWGIGPTAVFASAAALFLYQELEATIFMPGDQVQVSVLEKTLVSSMVLGMLSLMVHLWVCSMRLFEYYLDTLIKDSPNMLLEMTTAGLLGNSTEIMPLGPLTRFLRAQQPQIHITVCWFLSLCYADYVRKNYCQRFNMPYLEQWQTELHERASRGVHRTMERVHSFVATVHQRLRGYALQQGRQNRMNIDNYTGSALSRTISKVSWGEGVAGSCSAPASATGLQRQHRDLCVRLVSQSSETTADAIERLRSLIQKTRCSCYDSDEDDKNEIEQAEKVNASN